MYQEITKMIIKFKTRRKIRRTWQKIKWEFYYLNNDLRQWYKKNILCKEQDNIKYWVKIE